MCGTSISIFHHLGSKTEPEIDPESEKIRFETWIREHILFYRFFSDFSSILKPAKPQTTYMCWCEAHLRLNYFSLEMRPKLRPEFEK